MLLYLCQYFMIFVHTWTCIYKNLYFSIFENNSIHTNALKKRGTRQQHVNQTRYPFSDIQIQKRECHIILQRDNFPCPHGYSLLKPKFSKKKKKNPNLAVGSKITVFGTANTIYMGKTYAFINTQLCV